MPDLCRLHIWLIHQLFVQIASTMADAGKAEAALMQGDPAMMEALVGQLMSPDNSARQGAEGSFQKMKDHVPEVCVLGLVRVLRQSPQADSRTFSAVLLRKVGFAAQVMSSSTGLACRDRNNVVRSCAACRKDLRSS